MIDRTPRFVIEEASLVRNLEILAKVKQEAGIKILLAQKAFANWFCYPLIAKYLDGAAASSVNEARLAYEEMGKEVHCYSPGFKEEEFEEYLKYSNHIVFNSLSQYAFFADIIKKTEGSHHYFLRVNPGYSEIKIDMYNPVLPGSRFGVEAKNLNSIPKGISGLHFHALCENDSYVLEKTLASFEKLFGRLLGDISVLNMGGGHFITHEDYQVDHLIGLLKGFKKRYPHIEIILEPGTSIAYNCGYLECSVIDIIDRGQEKIAIIDGSFTAHMPDTLEMPYQPSIIGAQKGQDGIYTYKIGGNSCLSGDYMTHYTFKKPLEIGSRLKFKDQIHYTTVKTTFFNGVQHPSIILKTIDGKYELKRRFSFEDFKYRLA